MGNDTALGFGLGLRPVYYGDIIGKTPDIDWFEVISENFLAPGGKPLSMLERIRRDYPIAMHGVSMSIASTAPLDLDYLRDLKHLADRFEPALISDHLCWTGVHGVNLHDLLPIPYTEESLAHAVERIARAQDVLKRRLVIENISSYTTSSLSEMNEWTFLAELTQRSGCALLLDINNVYVAAFNHGFRAETFLDSIPVGSVAQFHLAGHTDHKTHKIDTHDSPVCEEVWRLFARAKRRFGDVPTMIERDDNFPPFSDLLAELDLARVIAADARELEATR